MGWHFLTPKLFRFIMRKVINIIIFMNKFSHFFLLGLCLMLTFSCSKDAEVLSGSISGFVSDYTNANTAIAGATVTLNSMGRTKTTGSDGRYEFTDLEPGTYSISVSANEYQATTKQVTVYAGQSATCDFQLEGGKVSVELDPINLSFGNNVEQLSFNIKNLSNKSLTYTISNTPDYIEVSPSSGAVQAKGTQAVTLRVINRSSITTSKNGQITINIGSDSYTISFNVEPAKAESVKVDINPGNLEFGNDVEQLTFAITNNNSFDWTYKITSNLDILAVDPTEGKIAAGAKNTITVTVNDRKGVDSDRTGKLTIEIEGNTFSVPVSVPKYEESNSDEEIDPSDVINGLYTFFKFENNFNDLTDTGLTAIGVGTSFTESYNGSLAVKIPGNSSSSLNIPDGLIDQNKASVSFWVKDLHDGHIFHALNSENEPAFLLLMEDGKLKFVATRYAIGWQFDNEKSFTHGTLDGWHMITLTADYNSNAGYPHIHRLYIDGTYVDVVSGGTEKNNNVSYDHCNKFVIGGSLNEDYAPKLDATQLIIDNFRIYHRTLSDDEVKAVYTIESKNK